MTPESAVPQPELVAAFFQKRRTGLVTLVFTDLVDSTALLRQLGDTKASAVLDDTLASLKFEARVSSLAWIGLLFGRDYDLGLAGEGAVDGELEEMILALRAHDEARRLAAAQERRE